MSTSNETPQTDPEDKPCPKGGKHAFEFDGYFDVDDPEAMSGETRMASYKCKKCGKAISKKYWNP
jgi:hypothetical protein